jgi:hypothetical protein
MPIDSDRFGIEFFLSEGKLPWIDGNLPTVKWFVFFPNDELRLLVFSRSTAWEPARDQAVFMPDKFTITSEILGGPRVIRRFKLQSPTPRMIDHNSSSSTWAFTWERIRFVVEDR